MAKSKVTGAQSIQRATLLMRAIAAHNHEGIRLIDLAKQLPLDRTTIHRIIKALAADNFIAQDNDTRRYFLGQTLFELGLAARHRFDLRQVYQPILLRIAEKTGDTVFFNIRSGNDAVCVDRINGPYPVKVYTLAIGDRRPLGTSASGVAILSALPDEQVKAIIKDLQSSAIGYKKSQIRVKALLEEVKKAQVSGYAFHRGNYADVRAIAVPVKNNNGEPFAAIGVTAITSRMSENRCREIAEQLKHGASELERLLPAREVAMHFA